jgi:TolB-like protein
MLVAFVGACAAFAGVRTARADKPRVCVLVEEQHDGSRAAAGGGEARLVKGLLEKGYPLVERYDAEQARQKVSIDRMLKGETAGLEITGLHADVLVVARVSVASEQAPYGISYPVHNARIDVRAMQVDSGRIFYADSASGAAPGDAAAAAAKVAENALPPLLDALEKGLGERGVVELRVAGLKEAKAADDIAAALGKVAGVKSAKVRHVSSDATAIDLSADDAQDKVMPRIEAALAAHHLVVARRSAHVIEARYDEAQAARRSVAVAKFVNKTGRPDLAWVEELLPDVFETELSNSKYLAPAAAGTRPSVNPDKPDAKGIAADVVVVGKVEKAGGQLRLSSKAVRTKDGATLAAAQLFGSESAVAELGKDLVWKLDPPLYLKLSGKSSLEGYVAPVGRRAPAEAHAAASPSSGGSGGVHIDEVKLADLFPSRIGYYAQEPLGTITLRNDGARAENDVRVEISLGELSSGAQTIRAPAIPAGGRVDVPLKVVLEAKALLAVTQRRPARADLAVIVGDRREPFTEPVVLWDRNAVDWNAPDSVASFVTPHDPSVRAFAQDASKLESQLPPSLPRAVRTAAALFDAVVALGTRYARDPLSPYGEHAIDTVQFPRETLVRKAGDCDDLAVLYASLVQAMGQDARLVLTPGHIFVAVDAEVAAEHAERLGGADRAILERGHAWVPVEVTKLEGGFAAAWQAGLAEVGRYKNDAKQLSFVDVQRAWRTYPPFPMEVAQTPPPVPADAAKKLVVADASALSGKTAPAAPAAGPGGTPEEELERAVALARRGELQPARARLAALGDGPASPQPVRAAAANNVGNIDVLLKRYDDAVADYQSALKNGARAASVRTNLGVAEYLAGRGGEAKKQLQKAGTSESKKLLFKLGLAVAEKRPAKAVEASAAGPGPAAAADSAESAEGLRGAPGEARVDPADVLIWLK